MLGIEIFLGTEKSVPNAQPAFLPSRRNPAGMRNKDKEKHSSSLEE